MPGIFQTDRVTEPLAVRYLAIGSSDYASYYLHGFAELAEQLPIRLSLAPRQQRDSVLDRVRGRHLTALSFFELEAPHTRLLFCIDIYDDPGFFNPLALDACDFYFKVNYHPAVIQADPDLAAHVDKIHPAGPCFPVRLPPAMVGALIRQADQPRLAKARQVVRFHRRNRSLAWMQSLRRARKTADVHFAVRYYPQGHDECNEFRFEVMTALAKDKGLRLQMGFFNADGEAVPGKYRAFGLPPQSKVDYLKSIASSRIAVYIRGLDQCFSFKFGEQLALGMPIVGQPLANGDGFVAATESFAGQYAYESPGAIAEAVKQLARDPDALARIAASNRHAFDTLLSPRATVQSMLTTLGLHSGELIWARQPAAVSVELPGDASLPPALPAAPTAMAEARHAN